MSQRLRILLVEDNLFTRLGVLSLIRTQPDMEVVGEAADGVEGIAQFRAQRPDVVVADLRLPKLDGVQMTAALTTETPPARVLVLTYYEGDETIFQALRAGALGYLGKGVMADEFLKAVRTVAQGKRFLPEEIAARLADRVLSRPLSGREQQVIELIYKGLSNRQIAEELQLAERTIAMYVGHILEKLGARSRTEAVAVALQRGILVPE